MKSSLICSEFVVRASRQKKEDKPVTESQRSTFLSQIPENQAEKCCFRFEKGKIGQFIKRKQRV